MSESAGLEHNPALVPCPRVAEVAVAGLPAAEQGGVLSYAIPPPWDERVRVGRLVWVPLKRRFVLGVVTRIHNEPVAFALKPLRALVAPDIAIEPDRLALALQLARQTAAPDFAAITPFLPPGVAHRTVEYLRLVPGLTPHPTSLTPAQKRLVDLLKEKGDLRLAVAQRALGSSPKTVVARLEERGIIEREIRVEDHVPGEKVDRFVRLRAGKNSLPKSATRQRTVINYLERRARLTRSDDSDLVPMGEVMAQTGATAAVVKSLATKGVLETVSRSVVPDASVQPVPAPTLTASQAAVWRELERALASRQATPFLLYGVTGSGKTEIYLRAAAWCLRHGRSVLLLAPEIALASQVVRRVMARFPGQVAVLHSNLSDVERYATWQRIAAGECPIVVGPRSAIFAPVRDIGLIVLDEEHDSAYKQDGEPRYHARWLAEQLAAHHGASLILGSATPAIETFWRSEQGELRRLELSERVGPALLREGRPQSSTLALPDVEIVDMRLELHRGNASLFSEPLIAAMRETLARREQTLLLLNRRGLATVVLCRSCGKSLMCPCCDVPYVYHLDRRQLICHRCDGRAAPPSRCPVCGGELGYFGAGTERVEQTVRKLLPEARVLRWDQDAMRRARGHESLLRQVERREVDIVVGTQMIAKGFDLPLVTLVGVIHADTMLHLPDFRASERTFQLLAQVAGRAGRRAPGGRVIVQSYTPAHYAIQAAANHDFAAFYAEEIDFRRVNGYPPFTRLVRYLYRHEDEARCAAEAEEMARRLAQHVHARQVEADLLGPTPAFISRIRGRYQWQIVLRSRDLAVLLPGLPSGPGWTIDVDPQSLL